MYCFCLTFVNNYNYFEIHSCCFMYQQLFPFDCCIMFHCVAISQFFANRIHNLVYIRPNTFNCLMYISRHEISWSCDKGTFKLFMKLLTYLFVLPHPFPSIFFQTRTRFLSNFPILSVSSITASSGDCWLSVHIYKRA